MSFYLIRSNLLTKFWNIFDFELNFTVFFVVVFQFFKLIGGDLRYNP